MKIRMPLYLQILSVLLLHLSLLCGILLFAFNTQFGPGWEALMQTPVGDRVEAIGFLIAHQLEQQPKEQWNRTLEAFGKAYGVKFYIFDSRGKEVAGETVTLPDAVKERIARDMTPVFKTLLSEAFIHQPGQNEPKPGPDFFRPPMHPPRFIINTLNPPTFWIGTVMPGPPPFVHFGMQHSMHFQPFGSRVHHESPIQGTFTQGTAMPIQSDAAPKGFVYLSSSRATAHADVDPSHPPFDSAHPEFDSAYQRFDPVHPPFEAVVPSLDPAPQQFDPAHRPFDPGHPPFDTAHQQLNTGAVAFDAGHAPSVLATNPMFGIFHVPGQHLELNQGPVVIDPNGQVHTMSGNGQPGALAIPFPHMEQRVLIASVQNIWDCKLLADVRLLGTVASAIVVLSILIWLPFTYRITHGISELTAATKKIANGNFDVRVKTGHRDEIDSLAESVNSMSDRLESFVTGQRRFLGDIAHELCSPVSRLQIALELLRGSKEVNRSQLISDIQEEVEEMSSLINELLAFSKASLRGKDIELTDVGVEELLSDVVNRLDAKNLIQVTCDPRVHVFAEPVLLERAIANVLRNSIRYAGSFGAIDITVNHEGHDVSIKITDSGPGVPEESLPNLGQPFYRPEPSRNRNLGGAGLGLAIVKTCVESCGGTFSARNGEQRGLIVEINLPACDKSENIISSSSI
jgi:signal transduction histidine kinase